jgi:hypothetical protein
MSREITSQTLTATGRRMWVRAWAAIGRRVRIEAEIVAAVGVRAAVVAAGDAGVGDVLAVEGAAGGTAAAVVGDTRAPISAADFSDFADNKVATQRCGLFS